MINYQIETYEHNKWQPLKGWTRPFTDGTTLDETLDAGTINLSCVTRREPFKPFTRLRIIVKEDGTEKARIQRVVASSRKIQKTFAPSVAPLFDWQIETIELTKLLERDVCDSMTVTNDLLHDFDLENVDDAIPIGDPVPEGGPVFKAAYKLNSIIHIPAASDWDKLPSGGFWYWLEPPRTTIKTPTGKTNTYDTAVDLILNEIGSYSIEEKSERIYIDPKTQMRFSRDITWLIGSVSKTKRKSERSITEVCERLLTAGITRRAGIETPKYILNAEFAEKYKDFKSPEFYFTSSTLFEALLQVGGRIHAIPRLIATGPDDMTLEVTFDELGGSEVVDWQMPPKIYEDKSINIDEFCGTLDSPAQNILNTQDRINGAISEPDGNAYITVRTEDTQFEIDADHAIIRLNYPANQIIRVECGILSNGIVVGDITPYIYENAEYQTLSSYWGSAFPYSKAYALKYTKGDNKITALPFKIINQTKVSTAFDNPAIVNIIKAKTGRTIETRKILDLAFRVTYIPIITTRLTQRKPYVGDFPINNTLIYNQSTNTAETSFYGEKMKGAIARLGNELVQRTYDFYHCEQIPKCGQILDGMYVARVDCSYDIVKIRATILLTKNFNQLAEYVGLDSNYRLYDISEKQSVDRYVHYAENLIIGDSIGSGKFKPILNNVASSIFDTLRQEVSSEDRRITTAVAINKHLDFDQEITKTILPVVSFAFGNSICFAIGFADNYGAGYQSTNEYEYENKDESKDKINKRVQRLVPYGDALGEMEALGLDYYSNVWDPTYADQEDGGRANLYPEYAGGFDEQNKMGTTGNNPYVIQKDSREAIHHIYQMHFVSNRESIVVGSRLTTNNPLVSVTNTDNKGVLYFFRRTLNMLDSIIDLSGAVKSKIYVYDILSRVNDNTALISGIKNDSGQVMNAWGIIDPVTKMLYIGENVLMQPGGSAPDIYFTAVDNSFNIG